MFRSLLCFKSLNSLSVKKKISVAEKSSNSVARLLMLKVWLEPMIFQQERFWRKIYQSTWLTKDFWGLWERCGTALWQLICEMTSNTGARCMSCICTWKTKRKKHWSVEGTKNRTRFSILIQPQGMAISWWGAHGRIVTAATSIFTAVICVRDLLMISRYHSSRNSICLWEID